MISAIVVAAGQSIRMGIPKINLSWGRFRILGQIISVLDEARVNEIICVVGSTDPQDLPSEITTELKIIRNLEPEGTDMLASLKIGMRILNPNSEAFLIVLGDQPQIQVEVVRNLVHTYRSTKCALLIPSINQRRGHPWIVERSLWEEILTMGPSRTLRDFLALNKSKIHYLEVTTDSILKDIDTPKDYSTELLKYSEMDSRDEDHGLRST